MTGTLPSGWDRRPLGEVADLRPGRTPKALDQYLKDHPREDRTVPFFKVGDMNSDGKTLTDARTRVAPDEVRPLGLQLLPVGAVVFPKAGGAIATNKKRVMAIEGAIDLNCMGVVPTAGVHPGFLRLFLDSVDLSDLADGSVLPQISKGTAAGLPVPLPPIEEQRRIVDILEDHLSRLEAALLLLENIGLRAELLAAKIRDGLLTEAGGSTVALEELTLLIRNGIFVSRAKKGGSGVPILRIGAVRPLHLDLTDLRSSERTAEDLERDGALLRGGDLLFTRYNGNPKFVGACAVVPENVGPLTYPDKLIRVVADPRQVLPAFLALACSSGAGRSQIQSAVKTTSGQAGISGRDLRRVEIRVPDLRVQAQVVDAAQRAGDATQRMTDAVTAAGRRAAGLRRALLNAAFTGRLTESSAMATVEKESARV